MKNYFEQPLFIFEMANNHMGSLEHGLNMIRAFADTAETFSIPVRIQVSVSESGYVYPPGFQITDGSEKCQTLQRNRN